MDMKRYINKFTLAIVLGLTTLTSCSNDEWGNDNPEYQNVFIVAFADWGPKSNNDKAYSVAQGSQQEVTLSVADTGIGVKDKHHIFDRFMQETHGQEQEGSGLGLHIVKLYVDMMGGRVSVAERQQGRCDAYDLRPEGRRSGR